MEYTITFTLSEGDFQASMGRAPKSKEEFDEWARLCEKGLCNGHIDWGIIYECTRDAIGEREPNFVNVGKARCARSRGREA